MINVCFYKENDKYIGMVIGGHAGYAPKGQDIVCASVSSVCQNLLIALEAILNIQGIYIVEDGYMKLDIRYASKRCIKKAQDHFKAVYRTLSDIMVGRERYINIETIEWR